MGNDYKIGDWIIFVSTPIHYNDTAKKYKKSNGVKVGDKFQVDGVNRYGLSLHGLSNYFKRQCLTKCESVGESVGT